MVDQTFAYVVVGETGEYSGAQIWYVRAFLARDRADQLTERLNSWCRAQKYSFEDMPVYRDYIKQNDHPPEDSHFQCDSTGTEYSVIAIPLEVAEQLSTPK